MVHGVVTQSGGHVHVYSEPGLGTSFKIYLPAAGEAPVREEKDAGAEPERLAGTETVLLCEDEDLVRDLIDRILTEHGYRVLSSPGPVEALEALTSGGREIDLLITDVIMPQMSGPELAERIMAPAARAANAVPVGLHLRDGAQPRQPAAGQRLPREAVRPRHAAAHRALAARRGAAAGARRRGPARDGPASGTARPAPRRRRRTAPAPRARPTAA